MCQRNGREKTEELWIWLCPVDSSTVTKEYTYRWWWQSANLIWWKLPDGQHSCKPGILIQDDNSESAEITQGNSNQNRLSHGGPLYYWSRVSQTVDCHPMCSGWHSVLRFAPKSLTGVLGGCFEVLPAHCRPHPGGILSPKQIKCNLEAVTVDSDKSFWGQIEHCVVTHWNAQGGP